MSRWQRLIGRLARLGLRAIDPATPTGDPAPTPPDAPPPGQLRLHLFGANFDSPAEAERFCYEPPQPDYPVALTRELAGAYIDTGEVEVIHAPHLPRLLEFLDADEADDILLRLGADTTLILLTERAFGGMPYTLDDTETLTYLGATLVEV